MTGSSGPSGGTNVAGLRCSRALWPEARYLPSPNRDVRPPGMEPELIVIHSISLPPCQFGGPFIEQLFTNRLQPEAHPYFSGVAHLRVSAHVVIDRIGVATQYVPFTERAWHAGVSAWRGRPSCNDFSIGIELEGCDERPFTAPQYGRLAKLIGWLRERFPGVAPDALVGHADVAPGRKTDPGPHFDWDRLTTLLDGGNGT